MAHPIVEQDLDWIVSRPVPWDALHGKTVLISGAGGFIPAYMVETLLRLNDTSGASIRVIALARSRENAARRLGAHAGRADLTMLFQDVCDPIRVDGPIHAIVHAASHASPKYYGKDPVGTFEPNVLGTHRLLDLARTKASERFLFFSSGEVYGEVAPDRVPTREEDYGYVDPLRVRSCYAEGKRAGEALCVAWQHQHGVPATIVRPFHTYGPGLALDDGRVFADFVADVVGGRNITLSSDGSAKRAFCYLADATEAFFTVLLRGHPGEAYNVGNPAAEVSILELAETLVRMFPERHLRVERTVQPRQTGYLQSPISRNAPHVGRIATLGWRPTTSIEDGFRRTIRSFTK